MTSRMTNPDATRTPGFGLFAVVLCALLLLGPARAVWAQEAPPPPELMIPGYVLFAQKISDSHGGFTGELEEDDVLGFSLAPLGDLDGDGTPDVVMGALGDDDGGPERGAVWVLFLHPNGTVKAHQKISDTEGGFTGTLDDTDFFGYSVASLGDLDGDGVTDIVVGARRDDDGGMDRGAVWILFLNANGTVKAHQKISDTEGGFTGAISGGDLFSTSVASLGDLDGDGVTDLVVGASGDDDGGLHHGAVWVLFLNTDGTVKAHQKISDTDGGFTGTLNDNDFWGNAVATVGDLDGDGVTEIAVGAARDGDGGTARGAVWVLFLNDDGTVKAHQKISDTDGGFTGTLEDGDRLGASITAVGDLDGDGITDLVVGAGGNNDGGPDRGAVWVLFLDALGRVQYHQKISDTQGGFGGHLRDGENFGSSITAVGDLDGDGVTEIIVGVPDDVDSGNGTGGAVYVLFLDGQPAVPPFMLTAKKYIVNLLGHGVAKFIWDTDDVATNKVDFYIDGAFTKRTANDGKHKIKFTNPAAGPFAVHACEKNSTTACSVTVMVDFTGAPFGLDGPDAYDDAVVTREGVASATVNRSAEVPDAFRLYGAYPNPFNPATTIRYDLPEAAEVTLLVYDAWGRELQRRLLGRQAAGGGHQIAFEAGDWASGLYLYRVIARMDDRQEAQTGRFVLMK